MQELQEQRWAALVAHIKKWFRDPDIEAFELALSVAFSHYIGGKEEKPVWLHVIGPSGSGKTALVIEALSILSKTTVMSKITDKAFLSGFRPGGRAPKDKSKAYSFLDRIGSSQILLFKDFTTLLSERQDVQATVMAQLRELWDGELKKETGSLTEGLVWKGKVTILAACTPKLETHWSVGRALGERFLQVRLRGGDRLGMAAASALQQGHREEIDDGLHKLTKAFASVTRGTPPLREMPLGMLHIADMVARLRATVERSYGKVTEVNEPEAPTRIAAAMGQVAQAHASLFYRPKITEDDLRIARRMALDTIPLKKLLVLDAIPDVGDISTTELITATKIHRDIIGNVLDDLEALQVLTRKASNPSSDMVEGTWWEFTDDFKEIRKAAGAEKLLAAEEPLVQSLGEA